MTPPHHSTTPRPRALRLAQLALAWLLAGCGMPAAALIFVNDASVDANGNPTSFNTGAPTGSYANSGWQYVGRLGGGILGVPIGPRHFVAAAHIGGGVGAGFTYNGASYTTVAAFDDPASDLRIWQVDRDFPAGAWAALYRASNETGRTLVVFGAGSLRGPPVQSTRLNGWQWAASDGQLRWGTNQVAKIESINFNGRIFNALYAPFDQGGGGPYEAHAGGGDSSAPVFIDDGAGYKLAGVMAAVDCCFNTTNSGSGFFASIFDLRGLYCCSPSTWTLVTGPVPVRTGFYATRIFDRLAWIDGILALQDQTIAFPAIPARPLNQSPFTPPASASSGLPVTLSVVSGPATVSGNVVTLTGLGSVTLKAEQGGNGAYRPATPVQQSFEVTTAVGGGGSEGTAQVPLPAWAAALLAAVLACAGLEAAPRRRR